MLQYGVLNSYILWKNRQEDCKGRTNATKLVRGPPDQGSRNNRVGADHRSWVNMPSREDRY